MIIIGVIFLLLGLFFSNAIYHILLIFPLPILGVILFFAGLELVKYVKDVSTDRVNFFVALTVGVLILSTPYGYVLGMIGGLILSKILQSRRMRPK